MWENTLLEDIYRVAPWLVVGLILVASGYGYTRARMYLRDRKEPPEGSGGTDEVDGGDPER